MAEISDPSFVFKLETETEACAGTTSKVGMTNSAMSPDANDETDFITTNSF